jgi:predicted XRE-type DNA-binding protein
MSDSPEYTLGSGNVFADLEYPNADVVLLKARLAREISAAIREKQLTQAAAGEILGLDQPEVWALMRGRLAGTCAQTQASVARPASRAGQAPLRPKHLRRGHR